MLSQRHISHAVILLELNAFSVLIYFLEMKEIDGQEIYRNDFTCDRCKLRNYAIYF